MDNLERDEFLRFRQNKGVEDVAESVKSSGINKKKEQKNRKNKQRSIQNQSGALNAETMHLQVEETRIYNMHTNAFRERVERVKGKVEIDDEVIIVTIGYVMIRLHRKMKLESEFGRFFDRTAPQDPVAQLVTLLKQLGLKTEIKGTESSKEALGKLLTDEQSDSSESGSTPSLNEWRRMQQTRATTQIEHRSQEEFLDDDVFATKEVVDEEIDGDQFNLMG